MTNLRAELAAVMAATLADEAAHHNWTYAEVRPLGIPSTARSYPAGSYVRGDCSKGCQYLCWWVPGCPDPMGAAFGPWGNSQTIWSHLQHVDSAAELEVGDIVTFGPDGDAHATMVKEAGPDPLLWSFGHPGAPDTYRLSADGRPAQFCVMPLPAFVPTPVARLRARTGWFAWVAWRLGEGDWQDYRPATAAVRPAVPRLIPPSWWRRYARFLLRRKKGNPATR